MYRGLLAVFFIQAMILLSSCGPDITVHNNDSGRDAVEIVQQDAYAGDAKTDSSPDIMVPTDTVEAGHVLDVYRDQFSNDSGLDVAQEVFSDAEPDSAVDTISDLITDLLTDGLTDGVMDAPTDTSEVMIPYVSPVLCFPCVLDDECRDAERDTPPNLCVDWGNEGSFCGQGCMETSDCPEGYICEEVTIDESLVFQCLPSAGAQCACPEGVTGPETECCRENEDGRCCATRVCGDLECPAAEPTGESCNNIDDNCDGTTDEDLTQPCQVVAMSGTCTGVETCSAGSWVDCTARVPQNESCNNIDDNCDGTTDENLSQPCQVVNLAGTCTGVETCSAGSWADCTARVPQDESCNNIDDNCDGTTDENLSQPCQVVNLAGTCIGVETCSAGSWADCTARVPQNESCNNIDDNCDGTTDENLTQACQLSNGFGTCHGTETCASGSWVACTAASPQYDSCDGLDNDCDALTDEDFTGKGQACNVGIGECLDSGVWICKQDGSGLECNAIVGIPSAEICDGLDNNCDGSADEDWPDKGTTCQDGIGACLVFGTMTCSIDGSHVLCDAVAGVPEAEICDGKDNDCNGATDENWSDKGLPCQEGVGECAANGIWVCNQESTGVECNAETRPVECETCDGLDNDCDGTTDEDWFDKGLNCHEGTGECYAEGVMVCSVDGTVLECDAIPNPAVAELCDGLDNDCDQTVDEDFPDLGAGCSVGIGQCHSSGMLICTQDGLGLECGAAIITPVAEICDARDNDCDGSTDEDFPDKATACLVGVGQCSRTGSWICNRDQNGLECNASPGIPVAERCDGLDNDCDDSTDEDFPEFGSSCQVGVGECVSSGTLVCKQDGSGLECDGITGTPVAELCDGLDNDCDDSTDEDFPEFGNACLIGVGECENSGTLVCTLNGSGLECDGVPGTPVAELCDGLDNDCDDSTDENWPNKNSSCQAGTGECTANGVLLCKPDMTDIECNAVPGTPDVEICDGLDNDCNDSTDENLAQPCEVSNENGTCQGSETCNAGSWIGCTADTPTAEFCNNNDDNCDSYVDESLERACFVQNSNGTCWGQEICMAGDWVGCDAPVPVTESCNNADDNCNGSTDENLSRQCSVSNTFGTCHGTETCIAGDWFNCNAETPEQELCNQQDDNCDGDTDEGYSLADDPFNCGGCGVICGPYNNVATVSCSASQCSILECESGWVDLDEIVANGCEHFPGELWVDWMNMVDPAQDGSVAHPFDTIQKALAVAVNGTLIHVLEGPYSGPISISIPNVEIAGAGKDLVTIAAASGETVASITANGVKIRNVAVQGGYRGILATAVSGCIIENVDVSNIGPKEDSVSYGIGLINASEFRLEMVSISNVKSDDESYDAYHAYGLYVENSNNITVKNAHISQVTGGNSTYGSYIYYKGGMASGIFLTGTTSFMANSIVINDIVGGSSYKTNAGPSLGVWYKNSGTVQIEHAFIYNVLGGSNTTTTTRAVAACLNAELPGPSLIDHVTCVGSNEASQRGFLLDPNSTTPVGITSSIFANLGNYCIYNESDNPQSFVSVSYSNLFNCGAGAAYNATVASSCITTDPLFVDAAANDYHVDIFSPTINTGKPASDYCNEPAPNGCRVDMGAYGNTEEATSASGASQCACCEPDETETEEGFCSIDASQNCLGRDNGVICDDNSVCTSFDTCQAGSCAGRPIAGCNSAPLTIHVQPPASAPYSVDDGAVILDLMAYPVNSSGDAIVPNVPGRDRTAIYMIGDRPMMVGLVPKNVSGLIVLDSDSTAAYIVRLLVGGWLLPQDMTMDFISVISSEIDTADLVAAVAEANTLNESPFTTDVSSLRTSINSSLVTSVQSFELWLAAHPISWTPDDSTIVPIASVLSATGTITPSGRQGGFKPIPTVDVDFLLTTIHNDRVRPGRAIIDRLTPTTVPRVAQEDIPSGRFTYMNALADLFGGGAGPVEGTTTSLEPVSLSTGPNSLRLAVISSSTTTFIPESSPYHDDFLWAQRQFWWEIVFLPALEELFGFAIGESDFSCVIGLGQYALELDSLAWEGEDFSFIAVAGLIWDFLQGSDWGTCILGSWSTRMVKLAKVAGNLLNIVKVFEYLTNGTMGILSETVNAPAGVQWNISVCVPSCDGVICGDNQCGENCPDACPTGSTCNFLTSQCEVDDECNNPSDPCCSDGHNFDDTSKVCNASVATKYTCPNGSCGQDVYVSYQKQYCSGLSSSCDGALQWTSPTVVDSCDADEKCVVGQATCVPDSTCLCECRSGDCCSDGCHHDDASRVCDEDVSTQYYCPNGTGCGSSVYVRHQDRYCSGSSNNCDGVLQWDSPSVAADCEPDEVCTVGNSTCTSSSSCVESCNGIDDNGNGIIDDFSDIIPGCFTFVAHHRNCKAHSWYAGWQTTAVSQEQNIGNCPPNPASPASGCDGCTMTTKYCSVPDYAGNYTTCWSLADGNNFRTYTTAKSAAGVTQLLRHCYNTSSGMNSYLTGNTCSTLGSNWTDGIPATLGYMAPSQPSGTWAMTWRKFYVCSYTLGDGFVDHYISTSCGTHTTVRTLGWAVQ